MLLWRYGHDKNALPLPNRWLKLALLFVILLAVLFSFRTITGRDAGVTFLVLLVGLKLLEMRSFAEILMLLFLSYFLIFTNFLYDQSIFSMLYLFVVMWWTTAILIRLADKKRAWSQKQSLQYSGRLLAQAVPLMLVLFIFFPRIEGPFWKLPENKRQQNISGIDDTLELGNLSALSMSDEVAFRVLFDGDIPPPNQRYWRGLVLSHSQGKKWTQGFQQTRGKALFEPLGQAYRYTITLEPHQKNWLYSLDLPAEPKGVKGAYLREDYHIHSDYPITSLRQYQLTSYPQYRSYFANQRQARRQWRSALRLPARAHPRTRALVAEWQMNDPSAEGMVQQALDYFRHDEFYYTLEPPPLDGDVIDGFLFDTRAGFCEHYAAAFVTLMRAASVPARIVVGYQGGSMNPFAEYLIIRQRDAHAWAEVWLDDKGWVRVDPTAAVSPDRVMSGIEGALPEVLTPLGLPMENMAWLQQTRQLWDLGNNYWNQWVLGYGPTHQADILKRLGLNFGGYKALTMLLIGTLILVLAALALWLLIQQGKQKPTKLSRLYQRFCARLADCGVKRLPHEGAGAFAERASAQLPNDASQIRLISRLYVQLTYRRHNLPSKQELITLERAILRFKPKSVASTSST